MEIKQALELFRNKDYAQAYEAYSKILASDKSDKRYMYINTILTCIWFLYKEKQDDNLFVQFEKCLDEYLSIAAKRDTNSWANNIIEDLMEYLIEIAFIKFTQNKKEFTEQEKALKSWLDAKIKMFINALYIEDKRPLKLFYDAILQKVYRERTNFERAGREYQNVVNAKILGELFLNFTQAEKEKFSRSRSNIYQLFSELVYNDPTSSNTDYYFLTKQAVIYLDKSIEEYSRNLFAIKRKQQLNESIIIQEQLHRFEHDISSKLSTLSSLTGRLQRKNPELTEPMRMSKIMRDIMAILHLSRNETPEPESVDIQDLFEEIKPQFSFEIELNYSGTPLKWNSNFSYLKVILENLIKNSGDAYRRREIKPPSPAVILTAHFDQGKITVEDFAGGIKEELLQRDKLFEPYVSEKGVAQGTGLGLPTVKKACNSLGIDIKIESIKNKTTKFILTQLKEQVNGKERV